MSDLLRIGSFEMREFGSAMSAKLARLKECMQAYEAAQLALSTAATNLAEAAAEARRHHALLGRLLQPEVPEPPQAQTVHEPRAVRVRDDEAVAP